MPGQKRAGKFRRPVRSYVLRQGRLTAAQKKALTELWPKFGIENGSDLLDIEDLFGRRAPLLVEIGFGDGAATWRMAILEPEKNFIGIEVHQPGVGHLLRKLDAQGVGNVRIARADAVEFLEKRLGDGCLDGVRIWFPDPWPKKRHHKRRIIQARFMNLLHRKMAPGAILHIATDWQPYADHILETVAAAGGFANLSPSGDFCARPAWRPATKFEQRAVRLGHESRDMLFRRIP